MYAKKITACLTTGLFLLLAGLPTAAGGPLAPVLDEAHAAAGCDDPATPVGPCTVIEEAQDVDEGLPEEVPEPGLEALCDPQDPAQPSLRAVPEVGDQVCDAEVPPDPAAVIEVLCTLAAALDEQGAPANPPAEILAALGEDCGAEADPLVAEAGGPYSGEAGDAIAISGSGSGGVEPYACAWDDGGSGGSFGDAALCDTTYSNGAGDYTLLLTVTDAAGGNASDSADVTVSEPAEASCFGGDGSNHTNVCGDVVEAPEFEFSIDDGGDGISLGTVNAGEESSTDTVQLSFANGDVSQILFTLGQFEVEGGLPSFTAQDAQVCLFASGAAEPDYGAAELTGDCFDFTDGDALVAFPTGSFDGTEDDLFAGVSLGVPLEAESGFYVSQLDIVPTAA